MLVRRRQMFQISPLTAGLASNASVLEGKRKIPKFNTYYLHRSALTRIYKYIVIDLCISYNTSQNADTQFGESMKRTKAFQAIKRDLNAVLKNDPATRNKIEAALCSSGFHALLMYRFFHFLHIHRYFLLARMLSAFTRFLTGIEIHPGATLGHGIFIDHGSGVVIGETAVVGNNVIIYQGVTLGGTGKDKGKRHPTIEDDVMISSGAKVLGPFTVGRGSKIGAGSIVLNEVPPNATVVGVPGHIVRIAGKRVEKDNDLCQSLPDPVEDEIAILSQKVAELESKLAALEQTAKNKQH